MLMRHRGMIGLGSLLLVTLYLTSLYSYLLFHTVVELFTIVVAGGIFVLAWNARAYLNNNYLLYIAIAYVFVAVLVLFHTLAYPGMGVFAGSSANLTTQLWIAGRYLSAISWLLAPFFLGRGLRTGLQFGIYAAVTAFLMWSIFVSAIFPTTYIDGVGLTAFKKISEYVIGVLLVVAIVLLVRKRDKFDTDVMQLLIFSLLLRVGAEIVFTTYVDVYSAASTIGHLLRWAAYFVLYTAVVETGLVEPYSILLRDLKRTDNTLRQYASDLESQNVDLIRTEEVLRQTEDALRAQNEELDAYAHTVAHDLKNPLTVVAAAADVLTSVGNLSQEEMHEYLHQIKDTAFEMNSIIDDLLLLAEVRSADVPLAPVDMQEIVRTVKKRLNFLLKKYRARLVLPPAWPMAIGYAPWIQEVWSNYISNALKYGGPAPRIELGANAEPGGMIRFWAQDHGPGVPTEASSTLFLPFSQLRSRRRDGHGLGLSIVLHIVEKLGGHVGVDNVPGKGALFYFMLPAAATTRLAPAAVADEGSAPAT
jgi:signal transduction histidine kinase